MKTKNLEKKLVLKKETIAQLSQIEMDAVAGGRITGIRSLRRSCYAFKEAAAEEQ